MKSSIRSMVLANNNQFIVFNKPPGISLQKGKPGSETSLHEAAMAYCKHDLYVVHRVDQPVSGVVVFAKKKKAAAALSSQFKAGTVEKTYFAVVAKDNDEGEPNASSATKEPRTLTNHLVKNGPSNKSAVVEDDVEMAKEAKLSFHSIADSDNYTCLKVIPTTGRHHQIRVQLSHVGLPIKGDVKYGARRANKDRSIHLHAHTLKFKHPVTGQPAIFEAPLPTEDVIWAAFAEKI